MKNYKKQNKWKKFKCLLNIYAICHKYENSQDNMAIDSSNETAPEKLQNLLIKLKTEMELKTLIWVLKCVI